MKLLMKAALMALITGASAQAGPAIVPPAATQAAVQRQADGPRDHSLMTLAALIAQNQTAEMPCHLTIALQNGVTPGEIQAVITHLAFYSGWEQALSAASIAQGVFAERGIETDHPALAIGDLVLIFDELAIEDGDELDVRRKLWQLPDLDPRDRNLVTISALSATEE